MSRWLGRDVRRSPTRIALTIVYPPMATFRTRLGPALAGVLATLLSGCSSVGGENRAASRDATSSEGTPLPGEQSPASANSPNPALDPPPPGATGPIPETSGEQPVSMNGEGGCNIIPPSAIPGVPSAEASGGTGSSPLPSETPSGGAVSALGGGGGQANTAGTDAGMGLGGMTPGPSPSVDPPEEEPPVDAFAMALEMGFGTNIGNTLENTTSWETGWGQPLITEAFINGIASRGIKSVRVPVAWDTYAVEGVIDAEKMERVKEVVGWIEAAGMYSIVNIHWDGGWIFNEGTTSQFQLTDAVKSKFESYWIQIATAFESVGHKLVFEGLNEEARFFLNGDETQPPDYAALNELNQLFVTTVRTQAAFNGRRALLIAGFQTDIELTCVDDFAVPDDPAGPGKLFLSLHYYTPYTFCGLDTVESWGSPATTWGTPDEQATLQRLFETAASFSSERNIPVIIGEFGVTPGTNYVREPASRTLWMESVARAAFSHGMVPVLWDTGSEISRVDGMFSEEFQAAFQGSTALRFDVAELLRD